MRLRLTRRNTGAALGQSPAALWTNVFTKSRNKPIGTAPWFQQIEFRNDPAKIAGYAPAEEALGYDYLLVYDHSSFLKPPSGRRFALQEEPSFSGRRKLARRRGAVSAGSRAARGRPPTADRARRLLLCSGAILREK